MSSQSTSKRIKKSMSDYEFVNLENKNSPLLGRGAFGEVKLVKDKLEGKLYALKSVIFLIFFFAK